MCDDVTEDGETVFTTLGRAEGVRRVKTRVELVRREDEGARRDGKNNG